LKNGTTRATPDLQPNVRLPPPHHPQRLRSNTALKEATKETAEMRAFWLRFLDSCWIQ
jgi:hypothetical protein